jgi:hypothetical protein
MRFVRSAAILRPSDWLRRLVCAGLLFAIVVAGMVAMLHSFEASKECRGAFSNGFSNGFDRYRCELKLRIIENGPQLTIVLPI